MRERALRRLCWCTVRDLARAAFCLSQHLQPTFISRGVPCAHSGHCCGTEGLECDEVEHRE